MRDGDEEGVGDDFEAPDRGPRTKEGKRISNKAEHGPRG